MLPGYGHAKKWEQLITGGQQVHTPCCSPDCGEPSWLWASCSPMKSAWRHAAGRMGCQHAVRHTRQAQHRLPPRPLARLAAGEARRHAAGLVALAPHHALRAAKLKPSPGTPHLPGCHLLAYNVSRTTLRVSRRLGRSPPWRPCRVCTHGLQFSRLQRRVRARRPCRLRRCRGPSRRRHWQRVAAGRAAAMRRRPLSAPSGGGRTGRTPSWQHRTRPAAPPAETCRRHHHVAEPTEAGSSYARTSWRTSHQSAYLVSGAPPAVHTAPC